MKKEIIKIVILSKDTKKAKIFMDAINQESKYFKEETEVVRDIEELSKISDIKILIYLISQSEQKKYSYEELESRAYRTIILDREKETMQSKETIKDISRYEDDRAIAFSILYDYYLELQNI